jgi:hypothetical protein
MEYINAKDIIKSTDKQSSEKNDCSVRAFTTALDVDYDAAHSYLKETFKREDKKGCKNMESTGRKISLEGKTQEIDGVKFNIEVLPTDKITNVYKLHGEHIARKKTVKSFIKDFSKGIYLILVSGHVFTVKNGTMIDNVGEEWRPTRKVESVFELKLKNTLEQIEFEFARFC